jgi:LytTr DNA-binding domain-containing protein
MLSLNEILKEPYPYEDNQLVIIRNDVAISIFVVLFLIIFKPFKLDSIDIYSLKGIGIFIGYGLVTFIISYVYDWLIRISFSKYFDEQNWNVGKQIFSVISTVFFIGLGNLFYSHFMGFVGLSGTTMLSFQLYTILIAIFPVTILTLIGRVRYLKKNLEQAEAINNDLKNPIISPDDTLPNIKFTSENEKDVIELTLGQFIYAESADNYTDVVYMENEIIRRVLIRSSLKRLIAQNPNPSIFSPHRAYIVNLRKISHIKGNAQGYQLHMEGATETIPVSRRNAAKLKEQLSALHP